MNAGLCIIVSHPVFSFSWPVVYFKTNLSSGDSTHRRKAHEIVSRYKEDYSLASSSVRLYFGTISVVGNALKVKHYRNTVMLSFLP